MFSSPYLDLGDLEDPVIVGDCSDDNGDLALATGLVHLPRDPGQRTGRTVDPGHKQATEDDLVELGIATTGQEPVELEKKQNTIFTVAEIIASSQLKIKFKKRQ